MRPYFQNKRHKKFGIISYFTMQTGKFYEDLTDTQMNIDKV